MKKIDLKAYGIGRHTPLLTSIVELLNDVVTIVGSLKKDKPDKKDKKDKPDKKEG